MFIYFFIYFLFIIYSAPKDNSARGNEWLVNGPTGSKWPILRLK